MTSWAELTWDRASWTAWKTREVTATKIRVSRSSRERTPNAGPRASIATVPVGWECFYRALSFRPNSLSNWLVTPIKLPP